MTLHSSRNIAGNPTDRHCTKRRRLAAHCLLLAAAATLAIATAGCGKKPEKTTGTKGKGETPAKTAKNKLTIAVIPKGTTHEFWKSVHAGTVKAKRQLNVKTVWKGPDKEDDRQAQINMVENFISSGVNGIVLAPLDDAALQAPVAAAKKAGIPVVIIDSGLKGNDYVSFVATDNLKGGRIAGEHLAKLLGGKGKVVMLRYQEGSASTMQREAGFLDAMSANAGIEVVNAAKYGGATAESAYQASENILAPYKKGGKLTIDGIFCPNESTTFGMLRALQDAKLAGSVRFVGFDSSEKLVAALQTGEVDGLVLQNPFRMGVLGLKTLVAHIRGERVESVIDTGVVLATRTNMADENIAKLLKPDLKKWLD